MPDPQPGVEERPNPCLKCGACCAYFRASFYYQETTEYDPDGVPVWLTEPLTSFLQVMKGMRHKPPHCIALAGEVGKAVACSIYPHRASVCREFSASYVDGKPNERCDNARAAFGLSPLTSHDWEKPSSPARHSFPPAA